MSVASGLISRGTVMARANAEQKKSVWKRREGATIVSGKGKDGGGGGGGGS